MKKIYKFVTVLLLLLVSVQVIAQESKVLCEESYYIEKATSNLNAKLEKMVGYSVSAPSVAITPGATQTN